MTGATDGLSITAIDADRTVDLAIRLPRRNPFDDPVTGSTLPRPLAGTVFTVRLLEGIDLATSAGWAAARSMSVSHAERGPFGLRETAVTDNGGVARLSGLPVGVYLVTSIAPGQSHHFPDYSPFLITLPTGGDWGWDYEPVVYAKPGSGTPTTTVAVPPKPSPDRPSAGPTSGAAPPPVPAGGPQQGNETGQGPLLGEDGPRAATAPDGPARPGSLASTGTAVALLLGVGAVLVGFGLLLRLLGRHREPPGNVDKAEATVR